MTTTDDSTDDEWPIAAAMINFPNVDRHGISTQDWPPEQWLNTMRQVAAEGFKYLDPTDSWLRIADLSPARRRDFAQATTAAGLRLGGLSTARRSIIDDQHWQDNLAYSHRVLDSAAELGITDVSFGLFQALTPAQQDALWFWTAPGYVASDDTATWTTAVHRLQELADHAAQLHIHISLEVYEDTYLGSADSALHFLDDINRDNVWLNPDIGNLQRLHRPVEHWQAMIDKMVPHARYWHIKNYFRTEDATTGAITTAPAPLELGVINYRYAIDLALDTGFSGAFLCEHYGGDGLSVSSHNRRYILRLLASRKGLSGLQSG